MVKSEITYQNIWQTTGGLDAETLAEIIPKPEKIHENMEFEEIKDETAGITVYRYSCMMPDKIRHVMELGYDSNKNILQIHGESYPDKIYDRNALHDGWDTLYSDAMFSMANDYMEYIKCADTNENDDPEEVKVLIDEIIKGDRSPEWPMLIYSYKEDGSSETDMSVFENDNLIIQVIGKFKDDDIEPNNGRACMFLPDNTAIVVDPTRFSTPKDFVRTMHEAVLKYNMTKYIKELGFDSLSKKLTEEALNEAKSGRETAKGAHEKDLEKAIEDISKLENTITAKQNRIDALEKEVSVLRELLDGCDNIPLLLFGKEKDLFPGEIKDFILLAIDELLKSTPEGTRRYDVLKDILDSNNYEKLHEDRKKKIWDLMMECKDMSSPKVNSAMKELGLSITPGGKHYKCTPIGDERYHITISNTPSDRRSCMNIANDMNKVLN